MFRRLPDGPGPRPEPGPRPGPGPTRGADLAFTIDGRAASGRAGDTVASALLAAGQLACRTTPVSGAPRAPYCLMGVCFECLVTIDGTGNRQGCLVPLAAGMRVETQRGARSVEIDRDRPSPAGEGPAARGGGSAR